MQKPRDRATEPPATTYYHGTRALAAVCISIDGFRLLPTNLRIYGYGAIGNGIYVTTLLETAAYFAYEYMVKVRMAPGTRILRLDGQYDRSVIQYLGREFGKELFSPHFDRAIPKNKHLTRTELIHLANYFWEKGRGFAAWHGPEEQGPMRRYLMKHQYDGVGCTESDMGVVVFNPSQLLIEGVFQVPPSTRGVAASYLADCLTEVDPTRLAMEAAARLCAAIKDAADTRATLDRGSPGEDRSYVQYNRDTLAGYLHELPRWQNCLRAFCKRHHLPLTQGAIASALEDKSQSQGAAEAGNSRAGGV
ncbi:MAG: hypothetical protein JWN14_3375 [Chthonomonadales bacterium]|nr:hypothetical protein [Chthonomonadales bacterium]